MRQIVQADASQLEFYSGWISRIQQFAVDNPATTGGVVLITVGVVLLISHLANSNKKAA